MSSWPHPARSWRPNASENVIGRENPMSRGAVRSLRIAKHRVDIVEVVGSCPTRSIPDPYCIDNGGNAVDNLTAMTTFTENVRLTLAARGWTIQDLANRTGIARPNLSKILSAKENVTLDRAERIANALDISLSDLLRPELVSAAG